MNVTGAHDMRRRRRKAPVSAATVSIYVRDLTQMFNSLDPSPAVENYYGRLASSERRALREHFSMAQLALAGGVGSPLKSCSMNGFRYTAGARLFERLAGIQISVRPSAPTAGALSMQPGALAPSRASVS